MRGDPRWMGLAQSYTLTTETNDDRAEGQHIHCWLKLQLLVSLTMPMHGTGCKQQGNQPSLFGALTYLLSNYSRDVMCILRIWLPSFTKSQTLNWVSSGHAQLHTTTRQTPVIIRVQLITHICWFA